MFSYLARVTETETFFASVRDPARFREAVRLFDEANAADPNIEQADGQAWPRELLYAHRLADWVMRLCPTASEELRLASRCQHLCRWMIPRHRYEQTRAGYLKWPQESTKNEEGINSVGGDMPQGSNGDGGHFPGKSLVRTFHGHADLFPVQTGHFFVKLLGQTIVAHFIGVLVLPKVELGQTLDGEGVGHDEAGMARGATEVHQAAFGENVKVTRRCAENELVNCGMVLYKSPTSKWWA